MMQILIFYLIKGEINLVNYQIGNVIKELRQYFHISQKDLAEGLCNQSMISRIEKGEVYPSAPLLYEIARRLGVDINYFFSERTTPAPRIDYAEETCKQIRKLTYNREYKEALTMVKLEQNNPIFRKKELAQFLLWMRGVCIYYLQNDLNLATKEIDLALSLNQSSRKVFNEQEIEIMISHAIIYSEEKQYGQSIKFFLEALHHFKRLPLCNDRKIEMRLYYNISKNYHQQQNFHESIKYAKAGIKRGLEDQSLYLLGHLYYQVGECYLYLDAVAKATQFMKESLWIFEKTNQQGLFDYVKEEITRIETDQHPKDFSDLT